jgi:chromosome segregation ATPase
MTEISGLTGVEDAMTALTALETERAETNTTPASANTDQRADQLDGLSDAEAQLNQLTDTPATAEPTATEVQAVAKTDATVETQAKTEPEAKGSKFAKDQQRRDTTWKALNADKESFTKERQAFEAERNAWKAEREAAEAETAVTPEKYEGYAAQMRARADHLKAEADRLEADGKFDEAETKREDARDAETDIRKATKAAEELRKNPPANVVQRNERVAAEKKEWTLKAAQDFPELAKDGSEFQKAVAANLSEIQAYAPGILRDPKSIYLVTRMTAMETAAAGVPGLKTKLSQTEARVKELEALVSPGAPSQHTQLAGEIPFEQRSREEQFNALERLATGMPLR